MKRFYIFLSACLGIAGLFYFTQHAPLFSGTSSVSSRECIVSSIAAVPIGHQLSTTVLSANSRRAWATIEQPLNATNTVAMAFATGTSATLTGGLQLSPATTSKATTKTIFGLNTDFPYTGAVTALTDTGSTTVRVTACNY